MFGLPVFAALLAVTTVVQTSGACNGPNPALVSAGVKGVSQNGAVNVYHLNGTVTNLGNQREGSNVLQFVDVYLHDQKVDSRGVPPLRPGQSYTFGYDVSRSADAGNHTSVVRFQIVMRQGSDCNPNDDAMTVRF